MNKNINKKLSTLNIKEIAPFGKLLNPNKSIEEIESSLTEMFSFENYHCFGLYQDEKLVGIVTTTDLLNYLINICDGKD